jgi:hypothetical protein
MQTTIGRDTKYKISINQWMCVSENGIWESVFEEGKVAWNTKKELLNDISCSKQDVAKKPKVNRIGDGKYCYIPKCCDTFRYEYDSSFLIIKITPENIEKYQEMLRD